MSSYLSEVRGTATVMRSAREDDSHRRKMEGYAERCNDRELRFGHILDSLDEAALTELAVRKFVFQPKFDAWCRAGKPLTGQNREALLHQLEVESRTTAAQAVGNADMVSQGAFTGPSAEKLSVAPTGTVTN